MAWLFNRIADSGAATSVPEHSLPSALLFKSRQTAEIEASKIPVSLTT